MQLDPPTDFPRDVVVLAGHYEIWCQSVQRVKRVDRKAELTVATELEFNNLLDVVDRRPG